MSFYDDDDDANGGRVNPLRKVVSDLEKKLEAEKKRADEAEGKLVAVTKTVTQRTVADVLKDKGANPALARYVLADVEDPTPEAVTTWLTENGELFGYKPAAPEGDDIAQALGLPAGTDLPPDIVAAYEKFAASQQGGSPSSGGDALAAKLNDPNLSQADLLNLINSASN